MAKKLKDFEEIYDLELDRAVEEIKKIKKKNPRVLIQLADGLKPAATEIADYLEGKTGAEMRIWLGTCFGACDIPKSDADLIIQFGHAEWI